MAHLTTGWAVHCQISQRAFPGDNSQVTGWWYQYQLPWTNTSQFNWDQKISQIYTNLYNWISNMVWKQRILQTNNQLTIQIPQCVQSLFKRKLTSGKFPRGKSRSNLTSKMFIVVILEDIGEMWPLQKTDRKVLHLYRWGHNFERTKREPLQSTCKASLLGPEALGH